MLISHLELAHSHNNNIIATNNIHPTALVDPGAKISPDVSIGPYTIIGENVSIDSGTVIGAHVLIDGWTTIGKCNEISTGAIIGNAPQDLKFQGETSYVSIGNNNVIREYATINRGTVGGGGVTRIGNDNYIMTSAHLAHDVQLGDHNVIVNGAGIGGHVVIDDWVTIGFGGGVHQNVRIGRMAMIGAGSMVVKDVTPFALVKGNSPKLYGINIERLRRNGYSSEERRDIHRAYKIIFKSGLTINEAIVKIEEDLSDNENINCLLTFLRGSARGIYR